MSSFNLDPKQICVAGGIGIVVVIRWRHLSPNRRRRLSEHVRDQERKRDNRKQLPKGFQREAKAYSMTLAVNSDLS